jgi:hypothetical protein
MATVITSPADVVNLALRRIGYKLRVNDLQDGSMASTVALDMYGQTRDAVLRAKDWTFAQREINGTQLKAHPTDYTDVDPWVPADDPPVPWAYSYAYPADCIRLKSVRAQVTALVNYNPAPVLFNVMNDMGEVPPVRVIVSNLPAAIITYTGQVTDPTSWSPDFTEALVSALSRRMATQLANLDVAKLEAQDEAVTMNQNPAIQGAPERDPQTTG